MAALPVILIHSSVPEDDATIAAEVQARYPQLTVLTASTDAEVRERLPQAEILFAWDFPMQFMEHADSLRWFQVMGAGLEKLAHAGDAVPRDVVVTNLRGVFGGSMSEYVLAYVLAHLQRVRQIIDAQSRHAWERFTPQRLADKTIGVIGLGSIGQEIARSCSALGMRVIGVKRSPGVVAHVERVYTLDELDAFLPECELLVSVVPHTRESTGLLSRERLRLLRPECFYINIGRGNIVALDDITEALREGWLAGAALDVFPSEPLPADHPLWDLDSVFITPHISGVNRPDDVVTIFFSNLERYLAGQPLLNKVDLARGY